MPTLLDGRFGMRPAHFVHERSGARAWLVEPLGMLTQIGTVTQADADVAHFFSVTVAQALMEKRAGDETKKLYFFHDWRRLTGYTSEARQIMTSWGVAMRPHAERIVVALAEEAKVARMGVSVASVALQLAGFAVETTTDLQPTLDRLAVHPLP